MARKKKLLKAAHQYEAKILAVYDGDTFTFLAKNGFGHYHKDRIRLYRVNTAEVRGASKVEGKRVRDYVRKLILNKTVIMETFLTSSKNTKEKKGKYGRWVCEVYIPGTGESLSDHLVKKKMTKYVDY